ncbi:DUF885 domain-containing protein [Sphingomonas tabacisoli]|uniref:DUF885 domain-containing protein n=1 Tax=Sphingomonas tabacisoli TaxID=2249466 RepID=A0ABW4I623_9SPHN
MLDRRQFLLGSASAWVVAALPAKLFAALPAGGSSPQLAALFDTLFNEQLRQSPESATQLGLDKGANADLRGKLSEADDASRARARALTQSQLQRLEAFPRAGLSDADKLNLDVVTYTRRSQAAVQRFDFGGSAFGPSPYVVSQLSGAYQSVPDFLDTKHPIETKEDADAYLSRLSAFGKRLDDETARMQHDAGLGVIPPDFILDLTIAQMTALQVPAAETVVVKSIARRAAAKGLGEGYARDAARIQDETVRPALDRQLAAVKALRARAGHDAGMWRFKDGPAFYETALHNTTTTRLSPAEVHQFGLDQAKMISSRLDALLKAQGMTRGTVGERMAALYKDPRQIYPDTDEGKAQAIAYCNERLAAIRGRLPRAFSRMPPYSFEVRRVPKQTEAGAASAFSQSPSIDGKRPGLVYFNLRDSAEWPKFCLATTVYHEGLPGHQFEGGLALSNQDLPLIRKTGGFSGYGEGWALYAEQLADELGMYDDDPLGRLGYLKFQLFRANRCVVDTGIHTLKWSREQAIRHFVEQDGEAPGFAAREVERYCVSVGQACSYKLGHSVFTGLREKAKAKMGARFDIKAFHDAVLGTGRVPLDILQQVGDRWIAAQAV